MLNAPFRDRCEGAIGRTSPIVREVVEEDLGLVSWAKTFHHVGEKNAAIVCRR